MNASCENIKLIACDKGTNRDLHTPQLSSHLAGHLQNDLGGHGHEGLWAAESASHHTLTGGGAVHTEELLDAVIFVLLICGEDHYHL